MIRYDRDQWEWNSRTNYPDGTLRPFRLDKVVLHWGGTTDPDGPDDVASEAEEAAILRGWQRYHIDGKGWTDIAYNFAVGNSGLLYRLRGFNRSGATSGDYDDDGIPENHEALAIVWIGGTRGTISPEAYSRMGEAIRAVFEIAGEVPVTVHSDHKATACPGDEWRAWRDRRGWEDGGPTPVPPPGGGHDMQTIRRGDGYISKGTEHLRPTVKAAQIMLAHHGFDDERTEDDVCGADGIFGPGTENAVKGFQADRGLVIDGQVGPGTWEALEG